MRNIMYDIWSNLSVFVGFCRFKYPICHLHHFIDEIGRKEPNFAFGFDLKRYFKDMNINFDMSRTYHPLRGFQNVGKMRISIPLGTKRFKSDYLDIEGGDFVYNRRKTLVSKGKLNLAQPLHLNEIENSFTLDNYYFDKGHLHPAYIKENNQNLRESFLKK